MGRGRFSDGRKEEVEERTQPIPEKRSFDPVEQEWTEKQFEDLAQAFTEMRDNALEISRATDVLSFDEFYEDLWTYGTSGFAARSKIVVEVPRKDPKSKKLWRERRSTGSALQRKARWASYRKRNWERILRTTVWCTSTGSLKFEEAANCALYSPLTSFTTSYQHGVSAAFWVFGMNFPLSFP